MSKNIYKVRVNPSPPGTIFHRAIVSGPARSSPTVPHTEHVLLKRPFRTSHVLSFFLKQWVGHQTFSLTQLCQQQGQAPLESPATSCLHPRLVQLARLFQTEVLRTESRVWIMLNGLGGQTVAIQKADESPAS